MTLARNLVKATLISALALASCKSPNHEGWVDMKENKINCSSTDSAEYAEFFDKTTKVTGQYFYNKEKGEIDSIIYSQGRYKIKYDKKKFKHILDNKTEEFKRFQLKFSINKS